MENALRNSGWFGILVNYILDMDRIELGTLNYSFMHYDLAQILRQPVRSTSNHAERFNVRYV
ncbi:MAG: hypothetical protein VXX79_09330 [Pseudomonadota bacterium]|nr:hypothetical protein [Pseudomonadota bacterium]